MRNLIVSIQVVRMIFRIVDLSLDDSRFCRSSVSLDFKFFLSSASLDDLGGLSIKRQS